MALSSPVYQVLPELSAVTHLSWVALHGMTHSFIELDKAVVHVISLVSFLCFSLWFSLCLPSDEKDKILGTSPGGSRVIQSGDSVARKISRFRER